MVTHVAEGLQQGEATGQKERLKGTSVSPLTSTATLFTLAPSTQYRSTRVRRNTRKQGEVIPSKAR